MVSQSDWFGSWPLLVPPKVKLDPNIGPKGENCGPRNGQQSTCCQSSSERKLYNNSYDILLHFILIKLYLNCVCVLTSIKSGLLFILTWKWTKRRLGDFTRPKKSRRRHFWTSLEDQLENKWGPTSTFRATKIGQAAPKGRSLSRPAAS